MALWTPFKRSAPVITRAAPGAIPPVIASPIIKAAAIPASPRPRQTIPNRRHADAQSSIAGAAWPVAFNTYEALAVTDDRTPISTIAVGPYFYAPAARYMFAPSVSYQRNRLASVARYLYDNYTTVGYAVDLIGEFSCPVHPESASLSPDWNKEADAYVNDWAENADFSGRFNFWELQHIASTCIDLDGDVGFSMTMEGGFPQLQMVEGWRIGVLQAFPDIEVIDGCILDDKGRIIGFVLQGDMVPEFVSANNFCLLWDAERFHSYRGYTALRRGSNDIRDRHDIKGFEKKATKIGSSIAATLEGGPVEEDVWSDNTGPYGNDPANPNSPYATLPNEGSESTFGNAPTAITQQQKQFTLMELLGGDIPVLPDGQKLHLAANMRPSQNTTEFMDILAGEFAAGLGIPPAFLLDAKLTGPNTRSVIGKAQKKFSKRSKRICKLARWTRLRVIGDAIARKKLPAIAGWDKIKPRFPAKLSIDLGDQALNDRADVQAGQMSRQERWGNRGMNWDAQEDQIAAEVDYIFEKAQALSTKYKVPIDTILLAFGVQPQNPQVKPPAEPPPAKEEEEAA
jgi:hypothetical protein